MTEGLLTHDNNHKVQKPFTFYQNCCLQKHTASKILALVAITGFSIYWLGIPNVGLVLNPNASAIDEALGQLSRAESAQSPSEVIGFITTAKAQLPESGAVNWWSPEYANFEEIQAKLDEIITRAEGVSSFEVYDERYNTEMYAIHAEIEKIQETLIAF